VAAAVVVDANDVVAVQQKLRAFPSSPINLRVKITLCSFLLRAVNLYLSHT